MIINAGTLQGVYRSFNTVFKDALAKAVAQSLWPLVAMRTGSNKGSTDYPFLGDFPQMREWVGERAVKDIEAHGFTIRNKDFESTVAVDRNSIDDDELGIYTPQFQNLGQVAARHRDILVFQLLASGFTQRCYDGQYFFDTDHPVGDQSVSNFGGGAGTPWYLMDLSNAFKPLILQVRKEPEFVAMDKATDEQTFMRKKYLYGVDDRKNVGFGLWQLAYASKQTLNAENYAAARAAIASLKNENGEPLGVTGTHLIVGATGEAAGRNVLKAEKLADNSSNIWFNSAELVVCRWLP